MLIHDIHIKHLHIGPQGLLAIIRQKYWPLRGRQLTKKIVNKCYRCFKLNPRPLHQLMGNLPQDRLIGTRPFLNTGIDYLGPIQIHHKLKGKRIDKAYVCVFVCFATKAVHLEVVSDLSSAAFIGALTRFIARRSCPETIYSDNGTNFKGAAKSLHEIYKLFLTDVHKQTIDKFCVQKSIRWKFIPARSPHIGGLWEAAVKSVKKHFHRAVEGTMTLEELNTVMTQIEAVLNSRPLIPLSNDPHDFNILTPGHFLVGGPLTRLVNKAENPCFHGVQQHWKAVEENLRHFWNRWSIEYLTELQKRFKWRNPSVNIEPNTLVLLKDDNIPPMNWRRGRVIKSIVGSDGKCRMVEVRTSTGITKRSIHNICPFPKNNEIEKNEIQCKEKENYESMNKIKINNHCIRKSTRIKQKNCIATMLMILFIMPISIKSELNISSVNDKSGILFENQGNVGLVCSHWDLVLQADMTNYWVYDDKIKKVFAELMNITSLIKEDALLIAASDQIHNKFNRIQQNNEIIRYRQLKKVQRKPRAILGFMGSIMHSIFGVMDEEHADMLEQKIKQTQYNDNKMLEMLKEQVTFQDVTEKILNKQNDAIWRNFAVMNRTMYSVTGELNKHLDVDLVLSSLTNCHLAMETFETMQKDIISMLWNSKGNFLEKLLPIEAFQQQIKSIIVNLKEDLQLPDIDPISLGQTAIVTNRVTNSSILFNVRIPLIKKGKMNLFILHSYPTWHDGFYVSINARFKYVLVDNQRTHYCSFSEAQFFQCKKLNELWLCPQEGPLYNLYTSTMCEISLFRANKISENCEIKIAPARNVWQQLYAGRYWIYSLCENASIDIECESTKTTQVINGQGLLQLENGCTLRTEGFTYTSYEGVQSDTTILWPKLNISFELPPLHHLNIKGELEIFKIPDIPKPKTSLYLPTNWELDIHDVWHYGMSLTNLLMFFAAIIVITFILRRLCSATRNVMPVGGFRFA